MTIILTPEQDQIVEEQLRLGRYQTPEDVVAYALRSLREADPDAGGSHGDYSDAVRGMLQFAEENRVILNGISVKELIHEGHRL